jgi:hypothetical protein
LDAPSIAQLGATNPEVRTPDLSLDRVIFASSKDWFLVDGLPLPNPQSPQNEKILFRKYFIYIIDGSIDTKSIAGHLGNTMSFVCQKGHFNYVLVHIPNDVALRMRRNQRILKMQLRILADGFSSNYFAEYINGDIFIDLTPERTTDITNVMSAKKIIVEFGSENDKVELYQADFAPNETSDLRGYLRETLPLVLKSAGGRNVRSFDQRSMLQSCARYRSGR